MRQTFCRCLRATAARSDDLYLDASGAEHSVAARAYWTLESLVGDTAELARAKPRRTIAVPVWRLAHKFEIFDYFESDALLPARRLRSKYDIGDSSTIWNAISD